MTVTDPVGRPAEIGHHPREGTAEVRSFQASPGGRGRSMRFTLRQLEYFIAAGETGSITQASERIHISQPSISAAITQLEQELDCQLFIRHHAQGLSLTPVGRQMLLEAKRLVEQAGSLYSIGKAARDEVRGQINVGCLTTLAPMVLPELSLSFTRGFPRVTVRPVTDHQEALLGGLHRATLDVCITYDLQIPADIDFVPLADLPVHVLVGESHPLARRSAVALEEIVEEPFILLDLPLSREYFLSLFYQRNLQPNVGYKFFQMDTIRTMVANGYGYTLANVTPRSDFALDGRRVVRVPLSGEHRPMTLGFATLRQLEPTRLQTAFLNHAKAFISDAYIPGMVPPAMGRRRV
nr:LysR family transcriptional regulator [Segnochrobactrum spirostomi]